MGTIPDSIWGPPPVSFFFRVTFTALPLLFNASFMEVSGLEMEMSTESLEEGGQSDFLHQLPKRRTHGNLVLKRSLHPLAEPLNAWVNLNLITSFDRKILPVLVTVSLLNSSELPVAAWCFTNAYPVKWTGSALTADRSEMMTDQLELYYNSMYRLL